MFKKKKSKKGAQSIFFNEVVSNSGEIINLSVLNFPLTVVRKETAKNVRF